jgi:hypothetical protein
LDGPTPTQGKKKKKRTISNNNKRHVAKRVGCLSTKRGEGAIPQGTVNKQAGWRRQERQQHLPSNQEWESL